jgi:hypothetical protein
MMGRLMKLFLVVAPAMASPQLNPQDFPSRGALPVTGRSPTAKKNFRGR